MENLPASGPASPADERLDSWKEIASYLKRSVRGVQRWEAEEGMPVHRHRHDKRGTVFAFKAELDAWWRERGTLLADDNGAEEAALVSPEYEQAPGFETPALTSADNREHGETGFAPVPRKPSKHLLFGSGFALAVLSAVLVAWHYRSGSRQIGSARPLPFQARDWVLVAGFENRTGDPTLDGMLDYALERELSNSRHVNVVPRERVVDVLRLMRKPPDTKVDATLGREICVRDGGIRTLLTGRIEKSGSTYPLSVAVVDVRTGTSIASFTEEAAGKDQIQKAIRRGSSRVREILGETPALVRESEVRLVKVTTPSLLALRLYSRADDLIAEGKNAPAEELLKQAVSEDPEFASAHIHLAWAIRNQSGLKEKFLPEAEIAYRLSDMTSERERYFIRGSYFVMTDRPKDAVAAYEALVNLYPDHFWASNNLIPLYLGLERTNEAMRCFVRSADLRPKSFWTVHSAAWHLARFGQDPAQVRLYVQRAGDLILPEAAEGKPNFYVAGWAIPWLELYPAMERWLEGDAAGALAIATRLAEKTRSTPSPFQEGAFRSLGNFFMALGRLKSAEECFRRLSEPDFSLALVSLQRGDLKELRRLTAALVTRHNEADYANIGFFLIRTGQAGSAQRVLAMNEGKPAIQSGLLQALRGEVAMARGRTAEAIYELKKSQESSDIFGMASLFLGAESLASVLARQGDEEGAVRVLERASRQKRPAVFLWLTNGGFWTRNQLLLAKQYRRVGRVAEADRIEAELTNLLAVADSDHPIVVELERLREVSTQANNTLALPIR